MYLKYLWNSDHFCSPPGRDPHRTHSPGHHGGVPGRLPGGGGTDDRQTVQDHLQVSKWTSRKTTLRSRKLLPNLSLLEHAVGKSWLCSHCREPICSINRQYTCTCMYTRPTRGATQEAKYVESWPSTTSAWAGWRRFDIPLDRSDRVQSLLVCTNSTVESSTCHKASQQESTYWAKYQKADRASTLCTLWALLWYTRYTIVKYEEFKTEQQSLFFWKLLLTRMDLILS